MGQEETVVVRKKHHGNRELNMTALPGDVVVKNLAAITKLKRIPEHRWTTMEKYKVICSLARKGEFKLYHTGECWVFSFVRDDKGRLRDRSFRLR